MYCVKCGVELHDGEHECPLCKAGQKIDALVNCHGCSKL